MKVYQSIQEFEGCTNATVTTGTFDGVHLGHRKIINKLVEVAKQNSGESVLLTFHPHPRMVLTPNADLKLINTISERIDLLEKAGVDHLIVHPFSLEFSQLSSLEFIEKVLVETINTKQLVIGYDHHFGKNREGSFEHLKKYSSQYGFGVQEISALDIDSVNVSSTKVRNALADGEIKTVNDYLGYDFRIKSKVISGMKIGSKIDYPTANLAVESYKALPKNGVYVVDVEVENSEYRGMLNVGVKPTVSNTNKVSVEVHIVGLNQDLYGQEINVSFLDRVRDEQKFNSLEELKQQLAKDKEYVLNYMS